MKIYAPNKDYNGSIAGVHFINGEAETENGRLLQWAKENGFGFEVEAIEVPFDPEPPQSPQSEDIDLSELPVEQLKILAAQAEISIKKGMRKAEIIAAIKAVM